MLNKYQPSKIAEAVVVALTVSLIATEASAASLLSADTVTAIGTGFTNLQDTVLEIIETAFPFMLGIVAVLAAPKLVKSMVSLATGR